MHGLIFHKLIGDGDSSVHQKLLEARPYGTLFIQKIECRNHMMRNFSKKIREICERKRSNSKNLPVPPGLRKLVESNARRLRTSIKSATMFRIREETSFAQKIENLKKDLKNAPSHVFGQHEKCLEIAYFNCSPKVDEVDHIPSMRACGLLDDIEVCINRLVFNASSLILDMDTNIAEQYNSIICKFVGGKRINFSRKRSYATRCKAAAISFNSAGEYYDVVNKRRVPFYTKKFIEKMKRRRELQKIIRRKNKDLPPKSMKKHALPDKDYGPDAVPDPDLPTDQFERKKEEFLNSLKKTPEEIKIIEQNTRGQSGNPLWQQERSIRLTASNFGDICKMRKTTSCANKVKNLLYSTFGGNINTKYGTEHEPFAIRQLENDFNVKVETCGMFVDEHDFIFGASPDGLIGDNAIVEVKCPKTASKMHPIEAIEKKIIQFCTLDENTHMQLKHNHNYYYQVQGQLHITQRSLCYFVVWTPLGILVEMVGSEIEISKYVKTKRKNWFPYIFCLPLA
ncbi:unnamed protein product [Phaedon cochleariae]|uniref:YqaJ viral recombinase domain-containing protein n=1 Tax=Phaedon cochleariae TaxID=80249 RepID=A0A9P0DRB2_PHACE|nr:unnamed protein product [Phaedon cochleariae]